MLGKMGDKFFVVIESYSCVTKNKRTCKQQEQNKLFPELAIMNLKSLVFSKTYPKN